MHIIRLSIFIVYIALIFVIIYQCNCNTIKKQKTSKSKSKYKKLNDKNDGRNSDRQAIIPKKKIPLNVKAIDSINSIKTSFNNVIKISTFIPRNIKLHLSSEFESLLLQMTKPNDQIINKEDIETLLRTINSFIRNLDLISKSNPYRVTLRKLWNKLIEINIYTKLKSLLLLHIILKSTDPEDCVIFKKLINKMSREKSTKSLSKYFDIKRINDLTFTSIYKKFLYNYSSYVLDRSNAFTSSFEEMKLIRVGMRTEDIFAQLLKANKIIANGLDCFVRQSRSNEEQIPPIILLCLEYIREDILNLFSIYQIKIDWLINNKDIFIDWDENEINKSINYFIESYNDFYDKLYKYNNNINKLFKKYHIKSIKSMDAKLQLITTNPNSNVSSDEPRINTENITEPIIENITISSIKSKRLKSNSKQVKKSSTKINKKKKISNKSNR